MSKIVVPVNIKTVNDRGRRETWREPGLKSATPHRPVNDRGGTLTLADGSRWFYVLLGNKGVARLLEPSFAR